MIPPASTFINGIIVCLLSVLALFNVALVRLYRGEINQFYHVSNLAQKMTVYCKKNKITDSCFEKYSIYIYIYIYNYFLIFLLFVTNKNKNIS